MSAFGRIDLPFEELHRYSLDQYHRLIEAGAFDEQERVELLEGLLVDMSPKSPRHERVIRWLTTWLVRSLEESRYEVGVGSPLTLEASEPEPDVVVLERGVPSPYHPSTATLVIEVAVSSLARDLGVKPTLYARAGIPEYWVLDLEGGRILVHRDPADHGYGERFDLVAGGRLTAAALTLPDLDVTDLLTAAGKE